MSHGSADSLQAAGELTRRMSTENIFTIYLDYQLEPVPRYGWGNPPHQLLNSMFGSLERITCALSAMRVSGASRGRERRARLAFATRVGRELSFAVENHN
jgi:hypothetical protein